MSERLAHVDVRRLLTRLDIRPPHLLSPADSVVILASTVHATFNGGRAAALRLLATLSPAVGDEGHDVEDFAGEEPRASLR